MVAERDPLPNPADYVSVEEAARLLGVAPKTLYNKFSQGRAAALRPVKILGGRWRIPLAAIREAWEPTARSAHGSRRRLRAVKVDR